MQLLRDMLNGITPPTRGGGLAARGIACASLLAVAMLFFVFGGVPTSSALPPGSFIQPAQSPDTPAAQALLRARELFDEENWEAAVTKFNEFIAHYPQDKNVPATYYWLAVALKKQSKHAAADEKLARLIKEFPRSNWATDARALRVEIAGLTRNLQIVLQSASDENENVRLTALQSLLRIDEARALQMLADLLKPDSGASSNMKVSAVTLLGRSGTKAATALLSRVVSEQTETKLRVAAIYALAQIDDPSIFDLLKGVVANSNNQEVAEAALYAVAHLPGDHSRAFISELAGASNNATPATRQQAILLLAQKETDGTVDELVSIYNTAQDPETRKQTLLALGLAGNPRAQAKLLEIARQQDGSAELRSQAILELGQRGEPQALEGLVQLYDEEKSEDIKASVILALAQSGEKSAARRLMTIGKSDPSQRLRHLAVFSLQRSSDPEVQKFLQELAR